MTERMVIDFHTHTFPDSIARRTMDALSDKSHLCYYADATAEGLARSMTEKGIRYSVNLPVMTRVEQVEHVNDSLIRQRETLLEKGIITFGGMHPGYPDPRKEIRRLKANGIMGVKLHPAYQGMHLKEAAYKRLLGILSEEGMITLLHTGMDAGYMEENYAPVSEILEVIRDVAPEKLVLAHMGGWQSWKDVEKDLAGAPVWFDTAFSLGKILPKPGHEGMLPYTENLPAEDFCRLTRKHGVDKVLFGTDSPWLDQGWYVNEIRTSGLTEEEQEKVLFRNAEELLAI